MSMLDSGYWAEVDRIDKDEWHALLPGFDDANFYQTWSFGEVTWGAKSLSHVVLYHEGRPVALAQLRILKFPVIRGGMAYLNWGPLWKPKTDRDNVLHLRNMARALKNEYVENRRLVLRIQPKIIKAHGNQWLEELFLEEGYSRGPDPMHTFIVDTHPPIDDIRQNLHRSWKRSLNFAEKQGLTLEEAERPEQYLKILGVYSQMKSRKRFFGHMQQDVLRIHKDLPNELKLKIMLCLYQEEPVATLGWSRLGKICMPLIGATGDKGLELKSSFLLWWEMIKDSKANLADCCDTATVHEKRNPGGHFFKQGLAGKNAQEVGYIGRFDAYCSRPHFFLMNTALAFRDKLINMARRIKIWG